MISQLKNVLGVLLIVLLVVGAYALATFANSYSKSIDPSSLRSFEVTAQGEVVAIPDIGRFIFSVITEGDTNLGELQRQNTEEVNDIIIFLKNNDVEKKDIKTITYSVEPRYQRSVRSPVGADGGPVYEMFDRVDVLPPPEIVGYTVRQVVRVTVRDLGFAGELLAGAVSNGANSVSQLSFEVDDIDFVQNEARGEAIKKAKEKAGVLANAGGFGLGKILSIREGGLFVPQARYFDASIKDVGFSGIAVPSIEPGSQDVRVSVTIVYEIR